MTNKTRSLALAALLLLTPLLAGCGVAENIVGGVVNEAQQRAEDAASEVLGGAGITSDGELPSGFPAEVPLVGAVQGGGSAPGGTDWVVLTQPGADGFTAAQAALEAVGFVGSAVDSDTDSGFGTFTLAPYTVVLTVATNADGVATATYVVTVTG
jgi:hypothetical protein